VIEQRCGCGRPLHYSSPDIERQICQLAEELGPTVLVRTPYGSWQVPRQYMALHKLEAVELPFAAARYGFQRAPD
jgi:hypothetical protein